MRFRSSSRCSRNDIFPAAEVVVVFVGRKREEPPTGGSGKGTRAMTRAYALWSALRATTCSSTSGVGFAGGAVAD